MSDLTAPIAALKLAEARLVNDIEQCDIYPGATTPEAQAQRRADLQAIYHALAILQERHRPRTETVSEEND